MDIIIAGDFCPQQRVARLFKSGHYSEVLNRVKPLLEVADYSVVNFECPICYGEETPIKKCGPNLKCSDDGIRAIKWSGFDCVTLANNHFNDFGYKGIKNTLEACNNIGLDYVGGGINLKEASQTLYKKIANGTLAIINCCEHEFSIASDCTAGSNPLNIVQQYYAIKEAKSKADYIIVIVHGGHEHFQLPSPRMVETYRFFVDAGADAVVNHHQHCYSGYEIYNGKPIFYGLGNFCFDNANKHHGNWTEGLLLSLKFSSGNPTFEIHPYTQCTDLPEVKLLPQDAFREQLEKLNSIISNNLILQSEINKYYLDSEFQYSNIFEPIQNRFYLAAKRRKWLPSLIKEGRKLVIANYIQCEAHRDKLIHWLRK